MELEDAKARMCAEIDRRAATLLAASHDIHLVHPQLFLDEVTAVVRAVRTGRTTLTG